MRGRGLLEETLVLAPSPQSLVSEGIAKLAPSVLLEGDAGMQLAEIMHDADIELDLAHALAIRRALEPCRWAEVNAALMLHEFGASETEVRVRSAFRRLLTEQVRVRDLLAARDGGAATTPDP